MELLEFKGKMFELLNVSQIKDMGEALIGVVLANDISVFDEYNKMTDNSKDWLQALWQYYEAERTEKKQDYTPKSLCRLISELAGDCKTIYDCCGGSGALTTQNMQDKNIDNVLIEELDERVIPFLLFNLCLHNASGFVVNGDALTRKHYKCYEIKKGDKYSSCHLVADVPVSKYDVAISNPPYNITWDPPLPIENDNRFPTMPPASNANYAFVLNCFARANKVVMILPNGAASERTEYEVRKYLVDNDFVETVAIMPDKMFECTSISTCILVLNKHKKHKNEILFIDSRKNCVIEEREQNGQFGGASHTNRTYKKSYNILADENLKNILDVVDNRKSIPEFSNIATNEDVAKNEYLLTPSRYIVFCEKEQTHRPYQEIADNINYITKIQNSCKLVINETIAKGLGLDVETFKKSKQNSEEIAEKQRRLGINLETEDYIQFTKNKNELIFKCNDKELLPDVLIQFFNVWKNQISLLNTMQNQYLMELRDALLPDLMSGKLEA